MTYREEVTSFIWSEYGTNRWTISAQDIINKKYTYYYKGKPIHTIINPYVVYKGLEGYIWMTNILLIHENDMNWISVRVGTIIDKIELRNDKLNNIL